MITQTKLKVLMITPHEHWGYSWNEIFAIKQARTTTWKKHILTGTCSKLRGGWMAIEPTGIVTENEGPTGVKLGSMMSRSICL